MLVVLLILMFCLLFESYYINNREVLAPSFVFIASFCFSLIWAMAYASRWDLNLHTNTFLVILLGNIEFLAVTTIVAQIYRRTKMLSAPTNSIATININQK